MPSSAPLSRGANAADAATCFGDPRSGRIRAAALSAPRCAVAQSECVQPADASAATAACNFAGRSTKWGQSAAGRSDCGLVFAAIHGADPRDATSVDRKYLWPSSDGPHSDESTLLALEDAYQQAIDLKEYRRLRNSWPRRTSFSRTRPSLPLGQTLPGKSPLARSAAFQSSYGTRP